MQSPKESDKNTCDSSPIQKLKQMFLVRNVWCSLCQLRTLFWCRQQHVIGTSPMHLPAIPETRDLRNALASFHMHPCTSRDAPQGCGSGDGSNSRPTDENNRAQANKPPKGQKAIGDFFMRTSSPAAAAADAHGQASEPACEARHGSGVHHLSQRTSKKQHTFRSWRVNMSCEVCTGSGESGARTVERCGSAEKHEITIKASAGALEPRRGDSAQGRKSSDFSGCAAHELQLLKAEKAVIAGELQKEKELRTKMQTVRFYRT